MLNFPRKGCGIDSLLVAEGERTAERLPPRQVRRHGACATRSGITCSRGLVAEQASVAFIRAGGNFAAVLLLPAVTFVNFFVVLD